MENTKTAPDAARAALRKIKEVNKIMNRERLSKPGKEAAKSLLQELYDLPPETLVEINLSYKEIELIHDILDE